MPRHIEMTIFDFRALQESGKMSLPCTSPRLSIGEEVRITSQKCQEEITGSVKAILSDGHFTRHYTIG